MAQRPSRRKKSAAAAISEDDGADDDAGAEAQRLDKWIWYARLTKSRTLAGELVTAGRVRINKQKVIKPSAPLKVGDVITITVRGNVKILKVEAPGTRRGPASEAQALYEDLSPPPPPKALMPREASSDAPEPEITPAPVARREAGAGRPTKRERRSLDRLRNWNEDSGDD